MTGIKCMFQYQTYIKIQLAPPRFTADRCWYQNTSFNKHVYMLMCNYIAVTGVIKALAWRFTYFYGNCNLFSQFYINKCLFNDFSRKWFKAQRFIITTTAVYACSTSIRNLLLMFDSFIRKTLCKSSDSQIKRVSKILNQ